MKTKKISWQAIAIVVLALVLIASIALGVSGAWFQDKDSASTDTTLGKEVTLRLKTGDGDVQTWETTYDEDHTNAYPGDTLLKNVKIVAGNTDTYALYRAKISSTVIDPSIVVGGDITTQEVATSSYTLKAITGVTTPDADSDNEALKAYYDAMIALKKDRSNYATDSEYNTENADYLAAAKEWNKFLLNNMRQQLVNNDWKDGVGGEYVYYKEVTNAASLTLIAEDLVLSQYLTNEVAEWTIKVSVQVEAIQAAHASEGTGDAAHPWNADLPTALLGITTDEWKTATGEGHCQTVYAYDNYRKVSEE